MTNEMHAMK